MGHDTDTLDGRCACGLPLDHPFHKTTVRSRIKAEGVAVGLTLGLCVVGLGAMFGATIAHF